MSERKQIILYLICTNKYHIFAQALLTSVEKYFLVDHELTVILFTDNIYREYEFNREIAYVEIPSYRYPEVSLLRYKLVTSYFELFEKSEAIYYLDIDMLIVAPITDEILPDATGIVAITHPGFYNGGYGSPNTHERSLGYVPPEKRNGYQCGGTQGGATKQYLKMAKEISENIEKDYETAKEIGYTQNNGILSEWHDETMFNEYLSRHPFKKLDCSYCYPESWSIPFDKKILALDKKHSEIRSA